MGETEPSILCECRVVIKPCPMRAQGTCCLSDTEPLCEDSGELPPGGVTYMGEETLCWGDFLARGLGESGQLRVSGKKSEVTGESIEGAGGCVSS